MARFCTKCGKELSEGEVCKCAGTGLFSRLKAFIPFTSVNAENVGLLERNKKIVPDSIRPNEGEQPIRQYRLAKLRSKIRGQYAEGRLQVTSKRMIFRATGFSTLGKTVVQQEFDITEIAGVEVKKNNRISLLNVFCCIFLSLFISSGATSVFEAMSIKTTFFATFLSAIIVIGCCLLFFILKTKHWLKLILFSVAIGAVIGTTGSPISAIDIVFGLKLFTFANIIIFILCIGWFFAVLRVCLVPDLAFIVKTKSASDVVQIRRRAWGFFFKQPQEYIGFSEVIPWDDTDKAAEELGAMINDLQMLGDMAIETWKED